MKKRTFRHLLVVTLLAATSHISVSIAEPDLDLQTLIAGIKHFDTVVRSGKGEFVYEHKMGTYEEKRTYAFAFAGTAFEEAQLRIDYHSVSVNHGLTEIYDGERQWEISEAKETLFSVDISRADFELLKKAKPELPLSVKEELKVRGINFSDDFRIQPPDEKDSYFKMVDNVTGHSYYIYYTEEYFSLYSEHLYYKVRPGCIIHAHLDPRFWMTSGKATPTSYLMTPLWEVLETYQSEVLGTEMLNGEEVYLVSVKTKASHTKSLKLWISAEKGFRLVKLEKIFQELSGSKKDSLIKSGAHYVVERVLHYQEYLPGIWFPEKVEQTIHPLLEGNMKKRGERIGKTTLQSVNCKLNTDVSGRFQLHVPEDTPVLDHATGKRRLFSELKQIFQ